MRPTRDELYSAIARLIATRGTCARRQVGCVLVDARGRILATGYNGVASGQKHCRDGVPCSGANSASGTDLDSCEAIHAEQNAILLLQDPWAVETAYVTTTPCTSCVKLLLGTSCKRIVAGSAYPQPQAMQLWVQSGRELFVNRYGSSLC